MSEHHKMSMKPRKMKMKLMKVEQDHGVDLKKEVMVDELIMEKEDNLMDRGLLLSSVKTLLALMDKKDNKKPLMKEGDGRVSVVVSFKKLPDVALGRWKNVLIKMPYCPYGERPSVCLFVKDLKKGKRVDDDPVVQHFKDLLKSRGVVDFVDTIMPFHMLRTEYKPFEAKRDLANKYDKFLADDRIFPYLPKILGKNFIQKNGVPIKLKLQHKSFNKQKLQEMISCHSLRLKPMSTSYHVPIGNRSMPSQHIVKNIMAVGNALRDCVPGGWDNVRSIMLKGDKTIGIPCHMSVSVDDVSRDVAEPESDEESNAEPKSEPMESDEESNVV